MTAESESSVKNPNVAGQFYEADAKKLRAHISEMLTQVKSEPWEKPIDVLMVPHAGHIYSGPTAAYGFKAVQNKKIKTVILLGPTHYNRFPGVAIWPKGSFRTPLGSIPIDESLAHAISHQAKFVQPFLKAFEKDHVLEVELPFLQYLFKDISIVPMIMNRDATSAEVQQLAQAMHDAVGAREDVLLLISSDLAHFHPAEENKKIDMYGLEAVKRMDINKLWKDHAAAKMEIDGFKEVITGLLYAQLRGSHSVELLKYGHWGEISGDHSRVVGYASMVFYQDKTTEEVGGTSTLSLNQKKRLMDIARSAIVNYVSEGKQISVKEKDKRLLEEEGAFVSIYKNGRLRGCIGNILGSGPLCLTVRNMAMASATRDTRFKPVQKEEIDNIELEISVLSKPRVARHEEIILGKHGVIVSRGNRSGVFLPQVADKGNWTKESFLGELCAQKAGLPRDCWKDPETKIEIYTAEVFSEKDLK